MPAAEVALVFDTDGTLLDGRQAVVDAVAEGLASTYRHFQLPGHGIDRERITAAIGLPATKYFRAAFDPDTVPAELHPQFAAEFEVRSTRAEVAALERGETELYEGVEQTLATLVERGHPLALFSNANAQYFAAVMRAHKLFRFFRMSISLEHALQARVARSKTGIVKYLAHGYPASVVIGDRIHDIEAGHSAGARTVGCLFGFGGAEELDRAHWTINSFTELLELPLSQDAE